VYRVQNMYEDERWMKWGTKNKLDITIGNKCSMQKAREQNVRAHSLTGDGSSSFKAGRRGDPGKGSLARYPAIALALAPPAKAAAALLPGGGSILNGAGVSGRLARGGRLPCSPPGVGGALLLREIWARMR